MHGMMCSSPVSWIVLFSLLGTLSFVSSSPESNEKTSVAIEAFRDGVVSNTSNDIVSSEMELLQEINKIGRRTKRGVLENVIAGLNNIGIVVSVVPGTGISSIFGQILSKLLKLFFPGGGDPLKQIQDIVWNERVEDQKNILISIRETMQSIKRQYEPTNSNLIPHYGMLTMYNSMTSQRCRFMTDDNAEASAEYFSEFATIHIAVNLAVILIDPANIRYQESLNKYLNQYIAYAKYAQQMETQENMYRTTPKTRVRKLSDKSIQKWTKLLPARMQTEVNQQVLIRNKEVVSFKLSNRSNRWLSCWGSGSECATDTCPGKDNPMERGSKYGNHWKCRGEIFWIEPIYDSDGFVKSCSKVGILYSKNDKGHWWLSGNCKNGIRCTTKTSVCVGDKAANMRDGRCSWEVWNITAKDKRCGEAIQDRDVVDLRSHQNKPPIQYYYSPTNKNLIYYYSYGLYSIRSLTLGLYTIFKSNVGKDEYKNNMGCRTS